MLSLPCAYSLVAGAAVAGTVPVSHSVNWLGHPDGPRQYDVFSGPCSVFRVHYVFHGPAKYEPATSTVYTVAGTVLDMDEAYLGGSIAQAPPVGAAPLGPHQAGIYVTPGLESPKYMTVANVTCAKVLYPTEKGLGPLSFGEPQAKAVADMRSEFGAPLKTGNGYLCSSGPEPGPGAIPDHFYQWGPLSLVFATGHPYPGDPLAMYQYQSTGWGPPGSLAPYVLLAPTGGTVGETLAMLRRAAITVGPVLVGPRSLPAEPGEKAASGFFTYKSSTVELSSSSAKPVPVDQMTVAGFQGALGNC
jgi:hypothetical protein